MPSLYGLMSEPSTSLEMLTGHAILVPCDRLRSMQNGAIREFGVCLCMYGCHAVAVDILVLEIGRLYHGKHA